MKKIKGEEEKKFLNTRFNLIEVVAVMFVTVIISVTITILVTHKTKDAAKIVKTNNDLKEVLSAYDTIMSEYYDEVDKKTLVNSAIEGMMSCLKDPYTEFYDEKESQEFSDNLEGNYTGIGIEIKLDDSKKLVVNRVFDESPASKAGVKSGDFIISIDGTSTKDKTLDEISKLIKDDKKTEVKIEIERDKKIEVYTMQKTKVDLPSVEYKIIEQKGKKIAKIDITTFANNTYKQFKKVYDEVSTKKVDGIILDLRGNTGGYLTTATSIIEMFVNKGDVMYQLSSKGNTQKVTNEKERIIKEKVVVLVNGASASASEILTATLKENVSSEVVGTKTYGKGKVQKAKKLANGTMMKYTIQNWLTPSGKEIDGKGVEPTIEVKMDQKYYDNPSDKTDNQLQKALEVITK